MQRDKRGPQQAVTALRWVGGWGRDVGGGAVAKLSCPGDATCPGSAGESRSDSPDMSALTGLNMKGS